MHFLREVEVKEVALHVGFKHLQLAHTKKGRQRREYILKEQFHGKPRMTDFIIIRDAIPDFFFSKCSC